MGVHARRATGARHDEAWPVRSPAPSGRGGAAPAARRGGSSVRGKPSWLKRPLVPAGAVLPTVVRRLGLRTVCEEALCPNRGVCFRRGTATFLLGGALCTRCCAFCAVGGGLPAPLDPGEPERVAAAVAALGLRHAVLTAVARDDLPDGGAGHMAAAVRLVRERSPGTTVEVLVPDYGGDPAALDTVLASGPVVWNHNLETVERLQTLVRPAASYGRSLRVLAHAAAGGRVVVKSGLMLGLGETEDEVRRTLRHLLDHGCRVLTLGQYLQPSRSHLPVAEYVSPRRFAAWRREALAMGFHAVAAGPLVRSSFGAAALYGGLAFCRRARPS